MRPHSTHSFSILFFSAANPGLPEIGPDGYNDRRKLPVQAGVSGGGHIPSGPELEMKRQVAKPRNSHAEGEQHRSTPAAETRAERLARIQREIAAGTYETPEKLEAAIERMLGVLVD